MDGNGPWRLFKEPAIATGWAAVGSGTGVLALFTIPAVVLVAVLAYLRVGRSLVGPLLAWTRSIADLERRRLRRLGHSVAEPYTGEPPDATIDPMRAILSDPVVRRDLFWLFMHGTFGLTLGLIVAQLPFNGIRDSAAPLWWGLVPAETKHVLFGMIEIGTWAGSVFGSFIGIAEILLWMVIAAKVLELQSRPGRNLLGPDPDADLTERVARLSASRAAALDAHAVELRRIERALHDGAQNRIVAVAVLIGAARREVARDPERADQILERAQDSVETALAELRAVVRSILPPVLENRGLEGALSALASDCAVPCKVTVDVPTRCPASVEATAYFVVAESLTNVAKHSEATAAEVRVALEGGRLHVTVTDDGRGGADAAAGSGLAGIARRVEAHDGDVAVASPVGGPTEITVELPCGS